MSENTHVMTEEQKAKQVESMKNKWQDPVYQAKVAFGRHTKLVTKLNAEIAEIDAKLAGPEAVDEATAKSLNSQKEALAKKLAVSEAKVAEAKAVIDAATPAPAPATENAGE